MTVGAALLCLCVCACVCVCVCVCVQRENEITFGRIAARVLTGTGTKEARVEAIQKDIDLLEASSQLQINKLRYA